MLSEPIAYYLEQSPYTAPTRHLEILRALGGDYGAIMVFLKQLLIHPFDAKGLGLKANYREIERDHAFYRTADEILGHPKVRALLENWETRPKSAPAERAMLSCDHHALLFTGILRLHGIPARVRAGFARYIMPGSYLPHWLCEVYEDQAGAWRWLDPERQLMDVPPNGFNPGGGLWLEARAGRFDTSGLCLSGKQGFDLLKHELLNDLNCLRKHELLNYDWAITASGQKKPALARKLYASLESGELALLDELAALAQEPERNFTALARLYDTCVKEENRRKQ